MHLNQFQVETEEIPIQRNWSHYVEDFLIYISAWESWMPLYLPHGVPGEYGLSGCHVLAFLPLLLTTNCLDRNWKWIAAVQHLHGEDQILNPELSPPLKSGEVINISSCPQMQKYDLNQTCWLIILYLFHCCLESALALLDESMTSTSDLSSLNLRILFEEWSDNISKLTGFIYDFFFFIIHKGFKTRASTW